MKRDSISAYVYRYHKAWHPSPPVRFCTHFELPHSIPLVMYILNEWPISQPKDK